MQNLRDPAAGVPPQLLPHMHLVSKYRYPSMSQLSLETVVEYLMSAPKIVRDVQPMHWTFLDAPADGTVMLVWQPLEYLGTNFASDGYVWADSEHAFNSEARGYTVEMWLHRSGYHPPNETTATHCRKRYRLTPPKVPNPGLPPCDPSLWIVHYSKADPRDHLRANQIPIIPQVQASLNQRRFLQNQGQLARKEFMLHDKGNWPTINLPSNQSSQAFAQAGGSYPPNLLARQQQQQTFFNPPPGAGPPGMVGPSANRTAAGRGHVRGPSAAMGPLAGGDPSLEEEEDVSRGDMLDFLTPRDISKMRYEQHHEWMEEIFASPYTTNQIVPVDLGLGRKGELEALTHEFFEAPTGTTPKDQDSKDTSAAAGKMDPEKAEEFKKHAAQKLADMSADLEKINLRHAKRMAKLERTKAFTDAEKQLRFSVSDPNDVGTEIWRIEAHEDRPENSGAEPDSAKKSPEDDIGDIVPRVEQIWGKHVVPVEDLTCISKGGLEEIAPVKVDAAPQETADVSAFANGQSMEGDLDMDNTAGGLMDQFSPPTGSPSAQQDSTPHQTDSALAGPSGQATPARSPGTTTYQGPSGEDTAPIEDQPEIPSLGDMDVDVEMAGLEDTAEPTTADADVDEWVMVTEDEKAEGNSGADAGNELQQTSDTPGAFLNTPGSGLQGLTPNNQADSTGQDGVLSGDAFDGSGDFGNMDSAGDALADYGAEHDDLNLEDLENSAFGEAYHAPEDTDHETNDLS